MSAILNVHQFAASWAARYANPGRLGHSGGDRFHAANESRRKTRKTIGSPADPKSDFSLPTQSDLSPANQRIHEILTGSR
jgi:hypothetical protein